MKTISSGLNTHINQEVTSLARCWKIIRTDGIGFFFTGHDADLTVDGDIYKSSVGFNGSAVANNSDMSVDNMDVQGVFDDDSIKNEDLRAGLFDYADVFIFLVNWQDTSQGPLKMRRGKLGEVTSSPQGWFQAEIRGMSQLLSQHIVELYGPECRADLGDRRCKIPIQPPLRENSTTYAVGDFVRVATNPGAGGQAQYENRIYKATVAGVSAGSEPTFDTTVGNTTSDGSAFATGFFLGVSLTAIGGIDGRTVSINSKTYTFQTVLTDVDGHIQIVAGNLAATMANLNAAINLTGFPGTDYALSTTINTDVTSVVDGGNANKVDLTAIVAGPDGNEITLGGSTITFGNISRSDTVLAGGTDTLIWVAVNAWTRDAVVATVTDKKEFTITVTEPRAVNGWFNYGLVTFIDGDNAGRTTEIKKWIQSGAHVTMFLGAGYPILVGTKIAISPGCNKTLANCRDKFDNLDNMRAESYLPGNDQLFSYPSAQG